MTSVNEFITQLGDQIDTLQADGQLPEKMAALSKEILAHMRHRRWADAAAAYDQAAELAAELGDTASEALCRYGQGTALFSLDQWSEAKSHFQRAAELAEQVGHRTLAAKSHHILAALALDEEDVAASVEAQTRAIEFVDAETEPALALQILRSRSTTYWLMAEFDLAQADLDKALEIARRLGDPAVLVGVETDHAALRALVDPETDMGDRFEALYEQAKATGRREVLGDIKLHQAISALRAGATHKALRHAESARQNALQSADVNRYVRYWAACLMLSALREQTGDRPGVIAILLTCKGTLEHAMGKVAGDLVKPFLDILPQRWGAEEFQAALDAYRRQAADRRAQAAET